MMMSLDWITDAITAQAPAGPDLWAEDDQSYSDYYFNALDRIDVTYLKPGQIFGGTQQPDELFDTASINLKSELASIDGLLKSTRDLRLLSLRARWSILAGKLETCAETMTAMADLLEAMPADAHPSLADGPADRLEALNDLANVETMLQPLRYLRLGGTAATLRRMTVARGNATARIDEDDVDLEEMIRDLRSAAEEVAADRVFLKAMQTDLSRISSSAGQGVKPHFGGLNTVLAELLTVLNEAVPDQAPQAEAAAPETVFEDAAAPTAPAFTAPSQPLGAIKTHNEAAGRLRAVERYFGHAEPSSAALLLVTQARMLLGKSLIEAFEALMPEAVSRAAINFSDGNGMRLTHGALRDLAQHARSGAQGPVAPAPDPKPQAEPEAPPAKRSIDEVLAAFSNDSYISATPAPVARMSQPQVEINYSAATPDGEVDPALDALAANYPVANAQDASAQLQSIIAYFNAMERSSPIPMLLNRARGYIGKDFETLMREFIPKQD